PRVCVLEKREAATNNAATQQRRLNMCDDPRVGNSSRIMPSGGLRFSKNLQRTRHKAGVRDVVCHNSATCPESRTRSRLPGGRSTQKLVHRPQQQCYNERPHRTSSL